MNPLSFFTASLREIRAGFRLLQVLALIAGGIAIVRMLFPVWSAPTRRRVKQAWAARLVSALGVRIDAIGSACVSGLAVSNHISWLDVFVINAITPTTFVCKDDVRGWPAIGWLVEHTGTLFIARGSRVAAARSAEAMAARLQAGERVALFPEGTTTGGEQLLPFRTALFEAAVSGQVGVQAAAIRYVDAAGESSRAPAYDGDISFVQSLLTIARSSGLRAEIKHLPPQPAGLARREYCQRSETQIAQALGTTATQPRPDALAA